MPMVIWDMDDTLYERKVPFANACNVMFGPWYYEEQGERKQLDYQALFEVFNHYGNEVFEASMNGSMSVEDMRVYRISKALEAYGKKVTREEALKFQKSYEEQQGRISLTDELRRFLQQCNEQGIKMGIITNGLNDHQKNKFDALGMERYIPSEYLLASEEACCNKPDLRIFRYAEQKWDVIPEEIWYIGDSYSHDIEGAKAAGWNTIWIDRKKKSLQISDAEERKAAFAAADVIVYEENELEISSQMWVTSAES